MRSHINSENHSDLPTHEAIWDLTRDENVVFDVGPYVGYLTLVMSRSVGQRECVDACGAHPDRATSLKRTLPDTCCQNTMVTRSFAREEMNGERYLYSDDQPGLLTTVSSLLHESSDC